MTEPTRSCRDQVNDAHPGLTPQQLDAYALDEELIQTAFTEQDPDA